MSCLPKSTFAGGSGSSSPVCPVSIMFCEPSWFVTIALLTHFFNAKSKYLTFTNSLSKSSSSFHSLLLSGVESISSTGSLFSSLSSEISAVFTNILSDVFGSVPFSSVL